MNAGVDFAAGGIVLSEEKILLVKNKKGSLYIMLIEKNKLESFNSYIVKEENHVLMWLDEL